MTESNPTPSPVPADSSDPGDAPPMFCSRCAYQLNGVESGRCPECGQPFHPVKFWTWRRTPRRRMFPIMRRLMTWGCIAALIACLPISGFAGYLYWLHRAEMSVVKQLASGEYETIPVGPAWYVRFAQQTGLPAPQGIAELYLDSATDEDLVIVGQLAHLFRLNLAGSPITDAGLGHLAGMDRLVVLDLSSTSITDKGFAPVGQLAHLALLAADDTQIGDDALRHLKALKYLGELRLRNTNVTGKGFSHLAGSERLVTLYLDESPATDAGLAQVGRVAGLEVLSLHNTKVSDAGLAHLASLGDLEALYLGGTEIRGHGLKHLADLTRLTEMDLSKSTLDNKEMAPLGEMIYLTDLDLSDTEVGDEGVANLAGCRLLVCLVLDNTAVADDGIARLEELKSLVDLSLRNTEVTGRGLERLGGLRKTPPSDDFWWGTNPAEGTLNLSGCPVTDDDVAHLIKLKNLAELDLSKTRITGAAARHLRRMKNLQTVYVGRDFPTADFEKLDEGLPATAVDLTSLRDITE